MVKNEIIPKYLKNLFIEGDNVIFLLKVNIIKIKMYISYKYDEL